MGTFNTYGNRSQEWGGAVPVWFTVRQKQRSGGTLENIVVGKLLRAGSLVGIDTVGGTAKVIETFEVAAAVTDTDTVVKVKAFPSYPIPLSGMNLMKSPATTSTTGKGGAITAAVLNETDGNYELTIEANALGVLAVGDILVKAAGVGASVAIYAVPTGLTENDVYIDEGTTAATVASVFDGEIMEDRIQPIPLFVKTQLPMIKFTKGV